MVPKATLICGKCNQELPKSGDYACCSNCNEGFHFDKCSGIKGSTWKSKSQVSQAEWACPSCRSKRKVSASEAQEESPSVDEDLEVSSMGISKSILEKVNSLLLMKNDLASIEKSMSFLAEKYDKVLEEMASLKEENANLKKEIVNLRKSDQINKGNIDKMTTQMADLDQYGRRCNLEIHGVETKGDPKEENLEKVLKELAGQIAVNYKAEQIHKAHRLQPRNDGKPSTILVQFFSKDSRDAWLQAGRRKRLRNIYFNENLCQHFRQLLKDTKLKAKSLNYSYVWWQGGKVMVRKKEGERALAIRNIVDLVKLGDI